jgi:hypothetical protein
MGAIWNFGKGTGVLLVQNMGHIGPVLRPRCIGPRKAQTQILFHSIQRMQASGCVCVCVCVCVYLTPPPIAKIVQSE